MPNRSDYHAYNSGRPGSIEVHVGTNPAEGQEISVTVPDGEVWRVINVRFRLFETGGTNGVTPRLVFDDGAGNIVYERQANTSVSASVSRIYNFTPGVGPDANAIAVEPLPVGMLLPPESVISTNTQGSGTPDYAAPVLLVEKWNV